MIKLVATDIDGTLIRESSSVLPEEIFDLARGPFAEAVEELEMREQTASEKLEHAFEFIEAAFADGQELVVFVTELAMDPEAAVFLAENENERFRKYNEQLLLGTKKDRNRSHEQLRFRSCPIFHSRSF